MTKLAFVLGAMTLLSIADADASVITPSRISEVPSAALFASAMEEGVEPKTEMARVEGLVARVPVDGRPVSERTVAYLGYDDERLFVVFMSYDRDATRIRSDFAPRDRFSSDHDSVALHIVTYPNGVQMNGFQANAAGAQIDGTFTEGEGWNLSLDPDWTVDARVTSAGYVVAMTIPFTSLRFPPGDVQTWGFFVYRGIPRRNEEAFFPAFTTRIAGRLVQAGTLDSIRLRASRNRLELTPYFTARDERVGGEPARADAEAGVDAKLIWRDRLVIDMTLNPDFSQVESDQPQVLANRRFEVFFPEKRPFFIENSGYFSTPINLLFTRRIVAPGAGLRMTGRIDEWSLGALFIDDRHAPEGDASLAVTSVRRHTGPESSVGMLVMHRTASASDMGMLSLHGRMHIASGWSTAWQASGARLADADETARGTAWYGSLAGVGEHWAYSVTTQVIDDGFEAPVGFVPRTGIREVVQSGSYRFTPRSSWLLSAGPEFETALVWERHGGLLDEEFALRFGVELPGQTMAAVERRYRAEGLTNDGRTIRFPQWVTGINLASEWFARVGFSAAWLVGDGVNFLPLPGSPPAVHDTRSADITAALRITKRLSLDISHISTSLEDVFRTSVARINVAFQFDRAWSARLTFDDLKTEPHPQATTIARERVRIADALVQWQPSPVTRLFVGVLLHRDRLEEGGSGRSVFMKYSRRFDY